MAKVWVLDTETKGTGANMVPLEKTLQGTSSPARQLYVPAKSPDRPPAEPEPRAPLRFRVIDVMTGQLLVDGEDARAAVDALRPMRSIVDVSMYVWVPSSARWRLLTFAERRAFWRLRDREDEPTATREPLPAG
jgi:hypothetical protein